MRKENGFNPQFNTSIKERNTMETIKFKYDTLFKDLWKESDKFEKIINDDKRGFNSLSEDDVKVHNKLNVLLDELKFQKGSEFIPTLNEKGE